MIITPRQGLTGKNPAKSIFTMLVGVLLPAMASAENSYYLHPWLRDPVVPAKAAVNTTQPVSVSSGDEHGTLPGLCGAIQRYRDIVDNGGWPIIPDGPSLKKDMVDDRVPVLRQRMIAEGDLSAQFDNDSTVFDINLHRAVRQFQMRNGLDADGVVGPGTLEAINVPATVRLATLLINLQRVQDWYQDFGDRFFVVNIASSQLEVIAGGELQYASKVIIGREGRETPVLHSKITRIDFNPYWNAPPSIARKDLLADIQNDPDYFARQHIRVFGSSGEVDAADVDWSQYDENSKLPYRFRQDPGAWNVLGPVKFVFANNHSVYLHGTSNESLFNRKVRTFSSGCVRVEQALDIAGYLATMEPGWSIDRIQELVDSYQQKSVTLSHPVPIHIIYRTAWVDDAGIVNFRPDIYDWDAILDVKWGHLDKLPCFAGREKMRTAHGNTGMVSSSDQKRALSSAREAVLNMQKQQAAPVPQHDQAAGDDATDTRSDADALSDRGLQAQPRTTDNDEYTEEPAGAE